MLDMCYPIIAWQACPVHVDFGRREIAALFVSNTFISPYFPASLTVSVGVSELLWRSLRAGATRPYCAAFSRSRMAPQERHTATPCLILSAQTGHSARGFES